MNKKEKMSFSMLIFKYGRDRAWDMIKERSFN